MDAALLFFALVWASLGRSLSTPEGAPPARPQPQLPPGTPEWPAAPPAPVPPPGSMPPTFPGPSWEYDEPPPPEVQQRARELLASLWKRGQGSFASAMTNGRWITYRAEITRGGKQGVVAYRVRAAAARAAARPRARPAPAPARAAARPAPAPAPRAPAPQPARRVKVTVGPAQIHPAQPVAPSSAMSLPTLRYGMGLKPQAPHPDVRLLQQRLGITADGQFGSGTRAAVIEYQRRKGLGVDGVVGKETWGALFSSGA